MLTAILLGDPPGADRELGQQGNIGYKPEVEYDPAEATLIAPDRRCT
jgi:hypothetical protein